MATRTRRLRWLDWALIATLVPLFVVLLALRIREGLAGRAPSMVLRVSSAPSDGDFPVVEQVFPNARFDGPALEVGDRMLQAGDRSLAGATWPRLFSRVGSAISSREGVRLEIARGGERFSTTLRAPPRPIWWDSIPFALACVLAGLIVLLRAPDWWVRRRCFFFALALGIYFASDEGVLAFVVPGAYLAIAAYPIGMAAGNSLAWEFTASARPLPAWARAQPWIIGIGFAAGLATAIYLPRPAWAIGQTTLPTLNLLAQLSAVAGLTRAYRRSDALERRQVRWALYGLYLAVLPAIVLQSGILLGIPAAFSPLTYGCISLLFSAIPIGLLVAIFGYRFLDIDRLISTTASYTILGVILLGVVLQVIPRVAEAGSSAVGVSPATGQWALSLGLVAIVVQSHRRIRPWLDRRMFAGRVAVEEGLRSSSRSSAAVARQRS